ncbi:hypothetical protein P7C70_g7997, partial [Phenoliferia sp. Uapishka_3]
MHMTIIPPHAAHEWLKEREATRRAKELAEELSREEAELELEIEREEIVPIKQEETPVRSRSSSRESSTSRRISSLLLSGSKSGGSSRRSSGAFSLGKSQGDEDEDADEDERAAADSEEDSSSSSDEEEEVLIHLPYVGSPKSKPVSPKVEQKEEEVVEQETDEELEEERDDEEVLVKEADLVEDEDVVMADASEGSDEDEEEDARQLAFAAAVPLPASPLPSAASPIRQTPPRPRHSTTRRLSLREKVLIRSAHTSANKRDYYGATTTAVMAHVAPSPSPGLKAAEVPSGEAMGQEEEEDVDAEGEDDVEESSSSSSSGEEEEVEQEQEFVQPVIQQQPSTPTPRSPAHSRDSIDVARSRSPKKAREEVEGEGEVVRTAKRVEMTEARGFRVGVDGSPVMMATDQMVPTEAQAEAPASPSPVERQRTPSSRKPRDSVALAKVHLAHAASIPLPETPAPVATISYTFGTPPGKGTPRAPVSTPEGFAAQSMNTPRPFMRTNASRNIFNDPSVINDALRSFQREMMSPINHHRLLSPPKSALRRTPSPFLPTSNRRKSSRGFLTAPPPSSRKRRVVFNTELFVQPIYNIKGKAIMEFIDDPDVRRAVMVPLPESPIKVSLALDAPSFDAPSTATKPPSSFMSSFQLPGTPVASGSSTTLESTPNSTRRAGRVATSTPALAVQRVMETPGKTPSRRAGRVPMTPVEPAADLPSASTGGMSHSKSLGDLLAAPLPDFTSPAGMGRSQSSRSNGPSLAELLASPAPRLATFQAPKTGPRNNKVDLLARIERLRRKSMPGQEYRRQQPLPIVFAGLPALAPQSEVVAKASVEQESALVPEPTVEEQATVEEIAIVEEEAAVEEEPAAVEEEEAISEEPIVYEEEAISEEPIDPQEEIVEPEPTFEKEVAEPEPEATSTHESADEAPSPAPEVNANFASPPSSPTHALFSPQADSPSVHHIESPRLAFVENAHPEKTLAATPTPSPSSSKMGETSEGEIEEPAASLPSENLDSIDLGIHDVEDLAEEEIISSVAVVESEIEAEPETEAEPEIEAPVKEVEAEALLAVEVEPTEPASNQDAEASNFVPAHEVESTPEAVAEPGPEVEAEPVVEPISEPKEAPKRGRPKAAPKAATGIPTRRGRAAKVVEVVEVVESEPEVALTVTPKAPTRRAKKDVVESVDAPATAIPASTSRSKRATTKVAENPATPKAKPAAERSSSRKRAKSVVIHEDEIPAVPALPEAVKAGPTPKTTAGRGRRVLQPSTEDEEPAAAKPTPTPKTRGRPKAVPAVADDSGVDENAAAEKKKPAAKKAPSLKKPGEPIPTGRALRSRG